MSSLERRVTHLEQWRAAHQQPDAPLAFEFPDTGGCWRVLALVHGQLLTPEEFAARHPGTAWPAHTLIGIDPHKV